MVKRELKRQPPSLFYKGDAVLVRIPISKKSVKGKKLRYKAAVKVVSLTPITIFTNITLNLMIQSQARTKKVDLKWTISFR